jgi:hypothetical protein
MFFLCVNEQGLLKALGENRPDGSRPTPTKPAAATATTTTAAAPARRVLPKPTPKPQNDTSFDLTDEFAELDALENAFADSLAQVESTYETTPTKTNNNNNNNNSNYNSNRNNNSSSSNNNNNNNNNGSNATQSDLDALDAMLETSLATGDDIDAQLAFDADTDLVALDEPTFEPISVAPGLFVLFCIVAQFIILKIVFAFTLSTVKQTANVAKSGGDTFDFDEVFGRLDLKALNELGLVQPTTNSSRKFFDIFL